jgi:hypothetical protein
MCNIDSRATGATETGSLFVCRSCGERTRSRVLCTLSRVLRSVDFSQRLSPSDSRL